MGLSAIAFQCNCSPGFSLQLRHRPIAQALQRGFRFNPAASQASPRYPAYGLRSPPHVLPSE